jgi:hypothetical protein
LIWGALALVAAALYMNLRVYLSNLDKFPHLERLLGLAAGYLLFGILFSMILVRTGVRAEVGTVGGAILIVLVSSGRSIVPSGTPWWLPLLGCLVVASLIVVVLQRLHSDITLFVTRALTALLLIGPVLSLVESAEHAESSTVNTPQLGAIPSTLVRKPDIFVVVLDGYPGRIALREVFDKVETAEYEPGLRTPTAWSSYPVSLASVTSMLEMGYPLVDGEILEGEHRQDLSDIIAGGSRFTNLLRQGGYRTTLVESGWSRSYCGSEIDTCIGSPFLDEGTFEVLRQSIFGRALVETRGSGLTTGAIHAMGWLEENVSELASNEHPDFLFATVLVPHPPVFLDSSCNFRYDPWRVGNSLYIGGLATDLRVDAYHDQIECASGFERTLFAKIPKNAVLIVLGDHGSDSTGQLSADNRDWAPVDLIERMNVHLSMRMPGDCDVPDPIVLPQVLQVLSWCLANGSPPTLLSPRVFEATHIDEPKVLMLNELSPAEVERLLATAR